MDMANVVTLLLTATDGQWMGDVNTGTPPGFGKHGATRAEQDRPVNEAARHGAAHRPPGFARSRAVLAALGLLNAAARPTAAHNATPLISDATETT